MKEDMVKDLWDMKYPALLTSLNVVLNTWIVDAEEAIHLVGLLMATCSGILAFAMMLIKFLMRVQEYKEFKKTKKASETK